MRKFSLEDASRVVQIGVLLLPTIFLISGFAYTNLLFYHLGFGAGGFLSFTDYLILNTVNVLFTFLILPFVLSLGYFFSIWNIGSEENKEYEKAEYDNEGKPIVIWFKLEALARRRAIDTIFLPLSGSQIVTFFTKLLHDSIIAYGAIGIVLVIIIVRFGIMRIMHGVPIIVQRIIYLFILSISLIVFIPMLVADNHAANLLRDDYKQEYKLFFTKGYEKYGGSRYIMTTSEYVFLFNHGKKIVEVIPKEAVISYRQISEQEADKIKE